MTSTKKSFLNTVLNERNHFKMNQKSRYQGYMDQIPGLFVIIKMVSVLYNKINKANFKKYIW